MTAHRLEVWAEVFAIILASVLLLSACEGKSKPVTSHPGSIATTTTATGNETTGHAIAKVDLSGAGSPQDTLEGVEQVVEERLDAAEIDHDVSQTGDDELTIDFTSRRSADFVKRLIEAIWMEFRVPSTDQARFVECRGADGPFAVRPENLTSAKDSDGSRVMQCESPNGKTGVALWQPAGGAITHDGAVNADLTSGYVAIAQLRTDGDTIDVTLDPDGTALLAQITQEFTGYPMGAFLGDELLSAPTIQTTISDGRFTMTGLDPSTLLLTYAIMAGGALPAPVTVTSISAAP